MRHPAVRRAGATPFYRCLALCVALGLSGCASLQQPPEKLPSPDSRLSRTPDRQAVAEYALHFEGAPYRYGGASPATGFDCSGFVSYVYGQFDYPLPRTTQEQARMLASIDRRDLMPGDLVFFNTDGRAFSHVGIYIGNNEFIHAPSSRTGRVSIASLSNPYWRRHFNGARRP